VDVRGEARIARWGVAVAAGVALAAAGAQGMSYGVGARWAMPLDMNTHASVFGIVSLLALATAIAPATMLSLTRAIPGAESLLVPALLAVLLGLRVLHPEKVVLYALPIVVATFVVLWRQAAATGSDARRVIRTGCVTLVGAYIVHALGALGYDGHGWLEQSKLLVGHAGELAGWLLVAAGLAAAYVGVRRA